MSVFRTPILIASLALFAGSLAGAPPPPPQRSVSSSRQFVVYAPDSPLRGAMCDLAERTKTNLLHQLQQPDNWKTTIVVNLQYPQANLPEMPASGLQLGQTGFGLKLELDLLLTADLKGPAIERDLLRALLLEMMYRKHSNLAAGSAIVQPPAWLLDGIVALGPGRDAEPGIDLLQTLLEANKIPSLEDFLRQKPELMDTTSRSIYAACSMALVQLLTDSPDGRTRLGRFINDLADSSNDPAANLKAHFPALVASGQSTEKWWTLSIARLSAVDRYKLFTLNETEARLDRLLKITLMAADGLPKTYKLREFVGFMKAPKRAAALHQTSQELLLLGARANPLYRAIVQEYQDIAERLALGKTKGIKERIARVESYREGVTGRMQDISDYMNWYEATQSATRSDAFASYLQEARASRQAEPRRRDPISVYMDALESEFQ